MNPLQAAGTWIFRQPYLLLVATTLFWGGNAAAGKLAVGELSPMTLTFLRWSIAAVLLLAIGRRQLRRDWGTVRASWKVLMFCGCCGFALFTLLLYGSLHYTSAINISIEQASIPVFIIIINFVVFRAAVGPMPVIGIAITLVGVAITASNGDFAALLALSVNFGDVLMLFACLAYAAYSVALRGRPPIHWISFLGVLFAIAAVACLGPFLYEVMSGRIVFGPLAPLILAYVIIFPSFLSQLFYARAVELIGPNRAGVFTNLVPIFGAMLAVLVAGEAFRLHHLLALAFVLAGVTLAERYRDRPWRRGGAA